jgi:colanic acid/amylovoran biosynthesis protein
LNILFQGTQDHHIPGCEYNFGGAAVITCTAEILRSFFPEAGIDSLMQMTPGFAEKINIRVVKNRLFLNRHYSINESVKSNCLFLRCLTWKLLYKFFRLDCKFLTRNRIIKEYLNTDLIIDLGMDCFNDSLGIFTVIDHCRDLSFGSVLNKPVILFAESPGPFNNLISRWLARSTLNRADLITIREKSSYSYLKSIGVSNPSLFLTADPAFLFAGTGTARIKQKVSDVSGGRPLIALIPPDGILLNTHNVLKGYQRITKLIYLWTRYLLPESVFTRLVKCIKDRNTLSAIRSEKRNVVIQALAEMAEELSRSCGAKVLLVPHVITPEKMEQDYDARTTIKQIYASVNNKDNVEPITENYSAQETKWLIGQCDMVISSKFHAAIAATSQCVPTLLIGSNYHHKNKALMDMLGLSKWNCQDISRDLTLTAQQLWQERSEVRETLKSKIPAIKELSLANGKLIFNLVKSQRP